MVQESYARRVIERSIVDEMEKSYIDYSMNVIVGRALPDARDGLKPVHRRILYGMMQLGLRPDRPHKKSARVVGEVLGKYHPHSDSAVYDAMARLAQDFTIRYPLVDGYGNFGSIDGDSPAAMRYTEARLTELAMELLSDIDQDTVDFQLNFDDQEEEPVVLPAGFPNLLVNGASGIAVGMSTSIPPHNLGEVCDALVALSKNPELSSLDLLEYIKGPDFPTGGILIGGDDLVEAYRTGRGLLTLRASILLEEAGFGRTNLILDDIPYQSDKGSIIEKIVEAVEREKVDGIAGIRDESDREGLRVVLELKRGSDPHEVLVQLYNQTPLETSVSFIMLALVNGRPQRLSLKEACMHYLEHRREVVTRRTRYQLEKALHRQHIVEGLIRAVDILDEVIALIRGSRNRGSAHKKLVALLGFSDEQARAILDLRLHRLTSLELSQLRAEGRELAKTIKGLTRILEDDQALRSVIEDELTSIRERFGDARRTRITSPEEAEKVKLRDAVPEENIVIVVTSGGSIKQVTPETYRRNVRQNNDGFGFGDEHATAFLRGDTRDHLLVFTDDGTFYHLLTRDIPRAYWNTPGESLEQWVDLAGGSTVVAAYILPKLPEQWEERYLVFVTEQGMVKKSIVSEYATQTSRPGQVALRVADGDRVVTVFESEGDQHLMLFTELAQSIRFDEDDVRTIGRVGLGVKGIDLAEGDRVVAACCVPAADDEAHVALGTAGGFMKRVALGEYRPQSRAGKGLMTFRPDETTGPVVGALLSESDTDELALVGEDSGTVVIAGDLPSVGRTAKGIQVVDFKEAWEGRRFVGLHRLP